MRRQHKLVHLWSLVEVKLDEPYFGDRGLLLEKKLVLRYVPVAHRLLHRSLKDHHTFARPNLQQVLLVLVELDDLMVLNLDQHRTEV